MPPKRAARQFGSRYAVLFEKAALLVKKNWADELKIWLARPLASAARELRSHIARVSRAV